MAATLFGSARIDERGKLSGGKAGDQTGHEVETQPYYNHKKGWVGLRPKKDDLANGLAFCMAIACGNDNIGYDQGNRSAIMRDGILSAIPTECDCSALVRACLKQCGVDVKDFTTATEKKILLATGKFDEVEITKASDCRVGDILVTKTMGHTGIIVQGKARSAASPKQTTPSGKCYVVKSGDSLSKIARRLGVTVDYLAKKNNIKNVDRISVGQKIYY